MLTLLTSALTGGAAVPTTAAHGKAMIKGANPGKALEGFGGYEDEHILQLTSTAGSGVMTVVAPKLWGYTTAGGWTPLGTGDGTTNGLINGGADLAESSTDKIAHAEVIFGLRHFERVCLSWSSLGGTATAVSVFLFARGEK